MKSPAPETVWGFLFLEIFEQEKSINLNQNMKDHRISGSNGPLNFTCKNNSFKTNIKKGYPHQTGDTHFGSVTENFIYKSGNDTLWFEHVIDTDEVEYYWFMWYDKNGKSKMPESSIIPSEALIKVINNIKSINF